MKIVLGDNPFFGVDHGKGSKELAEESERFASAARVIGAAMDHGIDTMMLSNHASALELLGYCDSFNGCTPSIALVIPVPNYYNDVVSSDGYLGLVKRFSNTISRSLFSLAGKLILFQYMQAAVDLLIEHELKGLGRFRSRIKQLCLHNVIVDMCLASGNVSFLENFIAAAKRKGYEAVLITQNYPSLLESGIKASYIACFSCNPKGYMTNPSLKEVLEALNENGSSLDRNPRVWLMQIFGSGVVRADDLKSFLNNLKGVESVLYATTKPSRIPEFVDLLKGAVSE